MTKRTLLSAIVIGVVIGLSAPIIGWANPHHRRGHHQQHKKHHYRTHQYRHHSNRPHHYRRHHGHGHRHYGHFYAYRPGLHLGFSFGGPAHHSHRPKQHQYGPHGSIVIEKRVYRYKDYPVRNTRF